MTSGAALAVETRGLVKSYGRRRALAGVDLAIEAGSVYGVIGPNGAGKTTTMRILLDLLRRDAGEVRVLGEDPRTGGAALRRRIGYLPGELALQGRVTGGSLLRHYAALSGGGASRIAPLAERLGLDLGVHVRKLSKGNKQKLGLVQAFLHEPALLVLDEPTSGLDPLVQQEFLALVREARDNGQTVFLSSHVLSEIQHAADRVAVLRAGEIISESDIETLRRRAARHVTVTLADGVSAASASAVGAALEAVPGVSGLAIEADQPLRVTATLTGEMDPLLRALAPFHVRDLIAGEPDLQDSVLGLYAGEASVADSPAPGPPAPEPAAAPTTHGRHAAGAPDTGPEPIADHPPKHAASAAPAAETSQPGALASAAPGVPEPEAPHLDEGAER